MNGNDVVIIGAPRSGTNLLRDVLTGLPGFVTWSCDEINPVWRHGNRDYPTDEFTVEMATPRITRYIRREFDRVRGPQASTVVEKTCANSLRVGFVSTVLPDSRILFIHRDGVDAAMSAVKRWHAPFDWRYTARKARYIPLSDVAHYAGRAATGRLRKGPHETWWGPRIDGWRELIGTRPLDEVAVCQWRRCVELTRRDLATVSPDRQLSISYERFVADPEPQLRRILTFLGRHEAFDAAVLRQVSAGSVRKGELPWPPTG